ncbi:MAG: hypothetical protein ABI671_17465 [Burkholderiales bacterium]
MEQSADENGARVRLSGSATGKKTPCARPPRCGLQIERFRCLLGLEGLAAVKYA